MEWKDTIINRLSWSDSITNRVEKEKVAQQIASRVENGDVIGIGSGSTVYVALFTIAEKIKREKLKIEVIPSSLEISMACVQLEIPQTTLLNKKPDWTFDGADEVDKDSNLLKGRGGALFKEKLLISSSPETYIIVDQSKFVNSLGEKYPIPVEVFPYALSYVNDALSILGATETNLRMAKGKDGPIFTENGNLLLDVRFDKLEMNLEKEIKAITGVVESGLFIGYDVKIISKID